MLGSMEPTKPIPNFSSYHIGNSGNIYTLKNRHLKTYKVTTYHFISIKRDDGRRVRMPIHRLVVSAWIGEIPKGMCVNHKNGDKHDNRLENLEIVTYIQNAIHARDVLKIKYAKGEDAGLAKLDNESAEAVKILLRAGWSHYKIARVLFISPPTISSIATGKSWTHIEV